MEERLHVERREAPTDRVVVRTVVEETATSIETHVRRDWIEIERRPAEREVPAAPPPREEGEWLIFSVVEQRPVVELRLFVVEEVLLRRRSEAQQVELPATVRSTRLVVDHLPPNEEDGPLLAVAPPHERRPSRPATQRRVSMSRTLTALFDTRADAETAVARLQEAGLDPANVGVHDKTSPGHDDTAYSSHTHRGLWASIKHAFLPDEDRHTYEEGVRRGGYLVTADVDEAQADAATRVLEDTQAVDVGSRSEQWRAQGWQGPPQTAAPRAALQTPARSLEGEQSIPIVEEQLVVGKREVDRGGVRVRSYVTETPVHEQVRLREERVEVERRKVDQPLTGAEADPFQERTIELTATGEEAVVGKTAHVVEEVRVFKTAEEHVADVNDTVRRTDVEIDRGGAERTDPAQRPQTQGPA